MFKKFKIRCRNYELNLNWQEEYETPDIMEQQINELNIFYNHIYKFLFLNWFVNQVIKPII